MQKYQLGEVIEINKANRFDVSENGQLLKNQKFKQNFRESNILTRFFYTFGDNLAFSVFRNKNRMLDEHIEEMTINDLSDDILLQKFESQIEERF